MKITKRIAAGLAVLMLGALCVQANPPGSGWNNVWTDNFDGGSVNTSRWYVQQMSNWSANGLKSWFYRSNCTVSGGWLNIHNRWYGSPGSNGEVYSGGRMDTKQKFTYGYFESELRMDWQDNRFWPAFWMWEWRSNNSATEFDIMELTKWSNTPSQTHHYKYKTGKSHSNPGTNVGQNHTWGVLWSPTRVQFYIDGNGKMESTNPGNAANDYIPIILSSSPNKEKNPPRTGGYPRLLVNWVRCWQGGNPGGGGGGGGGSSAPIGKTIALKSKGSNKFVKAQGGKGWALEAVNNTVGGTWEKFACVDAGGGYIALKSLGSNAYVQANGSAGWAMRATNATIGGAWEKFQWLPQSDGSIALKCQGSNAYVQANGSGGWALRATNGTVGGAWEKFTWSQH